LEFKYLLLWLKINDIGVVRVYDSYLNFRTNIDVSMLYNFESIKIFKRICNEFKLLQFHL